MKIITIIGARPQFIKASAISREILKNYKGKIEEILVHTGQHFDENMSEIFFNELGIPKPKYNLKISGGKHGEMTGRMMASIEVVLESEKPDFVLVYGDTNSTLAASLAAVKMRIPIAHVEAGLRSFNMNMPEEVNRIVTDRVSSLLFCPTELSFKNLLQEGIRSGVHQVGDVMFDIALSHIDKKTTTEILLDQLKLKKKEYILATCHRAENTDHKHRLNEILLGLKQLAKNYKVVLPLHPRTKKLINHFNLSDMLEELKIVEPLSYFEMMELEQHARVIITDSGGIQKEAYFFGVPCITMRDDTEWVETIEVGANVLAGANSKTIIDWIIKYEAGDWQPSYSAMLYGNGFAATKIIDILNSRS
jgi:UDP-GlcNAc3NAcA epimerase